MAGNSLLTDSMITKECLLALKNNLGHAKRVNRQYDDKFAVEGAKKGATINIRKPSKYVVTDGAVLTVQDSEDKYVPLTLDKQKHVGMAFSSKDLTLSIDQFRERYIDNAIIPLANQVETDLFALYSGIPSAVGVPHATTLPSTLKGFNQAKALLANNGAPKGMYNAALNPDVEASMVDGLKGLFHSTTEVKKQYEDGVMGRAAGCEFYMSQNIPIHTAGAPAGSPAIKTTITAQGAEAIDADGITGSITACYKVGDVIQIAGVYAVNPVTKVSTGRLKQFVVTATTDSVSNEIASLPISPAIYSTGANQNVDALPVDGAAITLFGAATTYAGVSAPQNLVFHRDAFVLGCADLEVPKGMHMAARASDPDSGLSLRLVSGYDIVNDRFVSRIDILYGVAVMYHELACRVVGQPA